MSESEILKEAHKLIAANETEKATLLLWKLYTSKNPLIRLNAILSLLAVLNYVTQNDKLLEITNIGIIIASELRKDDVRAFLLGKKGTFLLTLLSELIYRQKNLILSAGVFKWIDFSLQRDKEEFETIKLKRIELEKEVADLESIILKLAESSSSNYFRGHIFMTLGDFYSSKSLNDCLDISIGGKKRSMMGNIYFVRRWGLDKFILYKKVDRKKIKSEQNKCFDFFQKAIFEFETGKLWVDLAHAYYNLAIKYKVVFSFIKAKHYLNKARVLAESSDEKRLLKQIDHLKEGIADKNKNIKNYVDEFGLDLP